MDIVKIIIDGYENKVRQLRWSSASAIVVHYNHLSFRRIRSHCFLLPGGRGLLDGRVDFGGCLAAMRKPDFPFPGRFDKNMVIRCLWRVIGPLSIQIK